MSAFDPTQQGTPPEPAAPTQPAPPSDPVDTTGTAARVDTPPTPAPPATEPETPAADTATPEPLWTTDAEGELCYRGVRLFTGNPNVSNAFGILASLDLSAAHEAGQKRAITGTFPPEYEAIPKSGGAAYYYDAVNGQGWSVALNPEEG